VFEERRAVSETLGFVFAFALIVTTTGIVFTVGQGGLQNAQDQERLNNAERAMDVLAQNMNDLNRRSAPSRATEIRLSEASIAYGDPVTFTSRSRGLPRATTSPARSRSPSPQSSTAAGRTAKPFSSTATAR
jgi:hypothetical protein